MPNVASTVVVVGAAVACPANPPIPKLNPTTTSPTSPTSLPTAAKWRMSHIRSRAPNGLWSGRDRSVGPSPPVGLRRAEPPPGRRRAAVGGDGVAGHERRQVRREEQDDASLVPWFAHAT